METLPCRDRFSPSTSKYSEGGSVGSPSRPSNILATVAAVSTMSIVSPAAGASSKSMLRRDLVTAVSRRSLELSASVARESAIFRFFDTWCYFEGKRSDCKWGQTYGSSKKT